MNVGKILYSGETFLVLGKKKSFKNDFLLLALNFPRNAL